MRRGAFSLLISELRGRLGTIIALLMKDLTSLQRDVERPCPGQRESVLNSSIFQIN